MENKIIEKILQAEKMGEENISIAQQKASKIIKDAEDEKKAKMSQALDDNKIVLRKEIEKIEKQEYNKFQKELSLYEVECNNQKESAKGNFKNAIDVILKGTI